MSADNLYSAVYSGVPVYEFINPKTSVMRRKKDDWINATHILKVANFPKAKRTRILERDVQQGVHEKVQGGYGKYQGTWVPMDRAIEIAAEFNVSSELKPLFDYRSSGGASTPPPAPKHHHATSGGAKKARAAAAAAKELKRNSSPITGVSAKESVGPGRKRTLKAPKPLAAQRQQILQQQRQEQQQQLQQQQQQQALAVAASRAATQTAVESDFDSEFDDSDSLSAEVKQDTPVTAMISESGRVDEQNDSSSPSDFMSDDDLDNALQQTQSIGNGGADGYHRQLSDSQSSLQNHQNHQNHQNNAHHPYQLPKDPAQSVSQGTISAQNSMNNVQRTQEWFDSKKSHTQKLLEYFLSTEDSVNTSAKLPEFISDPSSGFDVNQAIDRDGNTTFHWACAMGDLRMCDALLTRGCNSRALNNEGQVPIMRSVLYTNSYTRRSFAKLLDLLRDSLLDSDSRGRTILHHIGFSTNSTNNQPSARYYTEILLTKIAETVQPMERIINFINQQDLDGNTALHIMSHNSANKCIRVLLGYNARVDIPNNRNEFVSDYFYNTSVFEASSMNPSYLGVNTFAGSQRSNVDSFNHMRPFVPSLNYHNASFNQQFSLLNASNYLTVPHYSEAAMQVSQKSGQFLEKLGELSNAFDTELQQRDSDIKELSSILSQMDSDVKKTEGDINQIVESVLKERARTDDGIIDFDVSLAMIKEELKTVEEEYLEKTKTLKKLIERSQAKDLALVVQQFETAKLKQLDIEKEVELKPSEYTKENLNLVLKLVALQLTRKETVDELVSMYADASENTETIASYRRLVSGLSNVPIDEVDESLNDIEECLKSEDF